MQHMNPGQNQQAVPASQVDAAWEDMLRKLQKEMPERAELIPFTIQKLIGKPSLFILLFMMSYLVLGDALRKEHLDTDQESKSTSKVGGSSSGSSGGAQIPTAAVKQVPLTVNKERSPSSGLKDVANVAGKKKKFKRTQHTKVSSEKNNTSVANSEKNNNSVANKDSAIHGTDVGDRVEKKDSVNLIGEKGKDPVKFSEKKNEEEKSEQEDKWITTGGLSWELQIPVHGFEGYFDGPSGSSEPWRILVPAIYVQAIQKKNLLTLELNPMFANMVPEKPFYTNTSTQISGDSTVSHTEIRALYKMFGLSLGINYMKNIFGNWWLGGTFQGTYFTHAAAKSVVEEQVTVAPGNNTFYNNYTEKYKITDEWDQFNKFQFFLLVETLYRKEKWQAGLRLGVGVTPVANGEGVKNPFRMSAFYRLPLLPLKKKN